MPLISIEWEGEAGVIVSPIPGPEMEISSSEPSIGLVRVTTTLKLKKKILELSFA